MELLVIGAFRLVKGAGFYLYVNITYKMLLLIIKMFVLAEAGIAKAGKSFHVLPMIQFVTQ